jgi:hypothetical protein
LTKYQMEQRPVVLRTRLDSNDHVIPNGHYTVYNCNFSLSNEVAVINGYVYVKVRQTWRERLTSFIKRLVKGEINY